MVGRVGQRLSGEVRGMMWEACKAVEATGSGCSANCGLAESYGVLVLREALAVGRCERRADGLQLRAEQIRERRVWGRVRGGG